MKTTLRHLFVVLCLGVFCGHAFGQTAKTRANLYTDIDTSLASGQPMTALQLRTVFKNVVASAENGLTDGTGVTTSGTYANPAWITSLAWSKLTGTPTTLAGYGIADSITAALAASTYQSLDGDLTALAALTGTNTLYYRSATNTWTQVTIGAGMTFSGGVLDSVSGGSGTVTSVPDGSTNGVTWTVATRTTTPTFTFSLGAIAPTSVNGVVISGSSTPTLAVTGTSTISGTHSGTSSGTNTGDQTSVTGNAGSATVLQTARTINGTSFNGSANITVTAAAETLTGSALPALSGASLTALNASNISSGTVPAARLGTGSGGATKFLREDGTWQLTGGGGVQGSISLTDAATIAVDATLFVPGSIGVVTVAGDRTLGNPTGAVDGQVLTFRVRQDGTGSRSLTLASKFRMTESVPTVALSTPAGAVTYLSVRYVTADDKFDVIGYAK